MSTAKWLKNTDGTETALSSAIQLILLSLQLTIIGSVILGVYEFRRLHLIIDSCSEKGWWPLSFLIAAFGKATLTHFLFWLPVLILCYAH